MRSLTVHNIHAWLPHRFLLASLCLHPCSLYSPAPSSTSEQPKSTAADLASKLHMRLQEYINRSVWLKRHLVLGKNAEMLNARPLCHCRVLASLSDLNRALHMDGFAAGCNCLIIMQETMAVGGGGLLRRHDNCCSCKCTPFPSVHNVFLLPAG